jgi:hypothetical protein
MVKKYTAGIFYHPFRVWNTEYKEFTTLDQQLEAAREFNWIAWVS